MDGYIVQSTGNGILVLRCAGCVRGHTQRETCRFALLAFGVRRTTLDEIQKITSETLTLSQEMSGRVRKLFS
jgi:hypothetical protein